MTAYIVRRLILAVPVLLAITAISFAALAMAPGDALTARVGPDVLAQLSPAQIGHLRHELGLDQAAPIRYLYWLKGLLHGKLGYSTVTYQPVGATLAARLPLTLLLVGTALAIGIIVGIPLGIVAAVRQYRIADYLVTGLSTALIGLPTFVVALLGILIFAIHLRWVPATGAETIGQPFSFTDRLSHLVLPACVLSLYFIASIVRYTRASMLEVLDREYLVTARAKGLSRLYVIWRHAAPNALIPVITVIGLMLPELVAGSIIIEQIFDWPGMGQLAVSSASNRDPAMLMGVILVVGIGVLVSNLLVDITYALVDPRVRLGERY